MLNLLLMLFGLLSSAQAPAAAPPAPATFQSFTDLMNVLKTKAAATPAPIMMSAPVKSGQRFQINVVRRTKPQGAIAHDVGSEIHSIVDGSATLVTGGTIIRPTGGGRGGGATIEGGESRRVSAGDVVLVPPQTPHWYKDIEGTVTYLEIRFDVKAPAGGPATLLPRATSEAVLAKKAMAVPAPLLFDAPVASGEGYQANVVRRTKAQGAASHALGTEVHHILGGSGTFVTGGSVVRPAGSSTGPGTIVGGESRQVTKGDVVLIPAGTPHWYKDVDGTITYLEVRFEVGKP